MYDIHDEAYALRIYDFVIFTLQIKIESSNREGETPADHARQLFAVPCHQRVRFVQRMTGYSVGKICQALSPSCPGHAMQYVIHVPNGMVRF